MNMKKSIAGVMAGALAVSAMATTASAWTGGDADQAQIVLSYDLNKYTKALNDTTLTVTYTFADRSEGYILKGLKPNDTENVRIGAYLSAPGSYDLTGVKLSANSLPQVDETGKEHTSRDTWSFAVTSDNADAYGSAVNNAGDVTTKVYTNGNIYAVEIPFTTTTDTKDKICVAGYQKITGGDINGGKVTEITTTEAQPAIAGAVVTKDFVIADYADAAAAKAAADAAFAEDLKLVKTEDTAYAATDLLNITLVEADNAVAAQATKYSYTVTPVIRVATKAGSVENDTDYYTAADYEAAVAAAEKKVLTGEISSYVATPTYDNADIQYAFKNYTVTLAYTWARDITGEHDWAGVESWGTFTDAVNGFVFTIKDQAGQWTVPFIDATATPVATPGSYTDATYAEPLRSAPNKPGNVIERLTANGYTYPQAVLNDVIANNENVAFTFTTSKAYVDTRDYIAVKSSWAIGDGSEYKVKIANPIGGTETKIVKKTDITRRVLKNGTEVVFIPNPYRDVAYTAAAGTDFTGAGNWHNPYFTQDLYQTWTWKYLDGVDAHKAGNGYYEYGPNGTNGSALSLFGSYASQWNKNLLAAGLVVNSAWTMQLNQATAFEWGDDTITFFWDDITADANVTNAANFLTSLQLYTPTEWYWDKLDVSVGAAIAENVASNAGLEEDVEEVEEEEVIEEEVVEEEPVEEEPVEEEPEEDLEEETEPVEEEEESVEEVETVEVESPKTGNAPVALAVIPVALAAAAVIAKKKN